MLEIERGWSSTRANSDGGGVQGADGSVRVTHRRGHGVLTPLGETLECGVAKVLYFS